jgi:hypothetical protein
VTCEALKPDGIQMEPSTKPGHGPRLPEELVERILIDAWCTLSPPAIFRRADHFNLGVTRYRWSFLVSLVHTAHLFRRLVLLLPFRFAIFRTSGDAQLYQFLIPRALAGVSPQDFDSAHRALFASAHVVMAWVGDKSSFANIGDLPPGPYTHLAGTEKPLVADATTVVSRRWGFSSVVQDWVCSLPSLATIRVLSSDIPQVSQRVHFNREIGAPAIKMLQLRTGDRSLRAMAELEGPAVNYLILFQLRSTGPLTMLTKQNLKRAGHSIPATITLLVLDTPPGVDGISDVSEWDIPGGLDMGVLLSGIRRKSEHPTIVVKSAKDVEPVSWQLAMEACERKGVVLRLEVVY